MGVDLGSAHGSIVIDAGGVNRGLDDARRQVRDFDKSLQKVGGALTVTGGLLAGLAIKTTLTAARTEELGVVLENVAKMTGHSMESIREQEKAVKDLGITTQVADSLLVKMMQNNLDLSRATDLARLAQDAAVISMEDSSAALDGILNGILTLQPEVLRNRGLMVNLQQAYAEFAREQGRTVTSLTNTEKQTIAFNEALKAGENIAGTYEAAMDTAGKQMRSMKRHVEELSNEFGQHLLPAMGDIVEAGTGVLKWARDLPEPLKATIAQVGGLGAGLATLTGAAIVAIPKVIALGSALGTLNLAIMGPLGVIAGLGALAIWFSNLEKAHQDEAATILESAESYADYVRQMERAGLTSRDLTEELYDQAKAAGEASEAFDYLAYQQAVQEMETLTKGLKSYIDGLDTLADDEEMAAEKLEMFQEEVVAATGKMTEMELMIAASRGEMQRLGREMGMSAEESIVFADAITKAAEREQDLRQMTEWATNAVEPWIERQKEAAAALKKTEEVGEDVVVTKEDLKRASDELADAVERVTDRYEGFYGTLAQGIISFRELGEEAADSQEEYEKALGRLQAKADNVYNDVKYKFEASLPNATTVRDRMSMTEDAWDEWGLRIQSIINDGVASPWYQTLQDMGYTKPPDQGVQEWAAEMKAAFYEGDLKELINQNAQAWVENAATQKQAQAEATQAYNQEVANRKAAIAEETAALQEARDAQIAAEQEARNRATIELALSLAEQTGQLQAWSEQRFGPNFSQVADSASEVLGLLDAGMLEIDGSLQTLITNSVQGVQTALSTTEGLAEETKEILDGIASTDWAEQKAWQMQTAMSLPESLRSDALASMQEVSSAIDEGVPDDPFLPLSTSFTGATDSMLTAVGELETEVTEHFGNIETEVGSVADSIVDMYVGNSVFPELSEGARLAKVDIVGYFGEILTESTNTIKDLVQDWEDGLDDVRQAIQEDVLDKLASIPGEITVTVFTELGAGGTADEDAEGRRFGGPVFPGGSYLVGEAGPELFMPNQAGTILPNPAVQALMAIASELSALRGQGGDPSRSVNIYGGVSLQGVQDAGSLLEQLAAL